jgi:L-lactate dehydrogenase complex protein LldF
MSIFSKTVHPEKLAADYLEQDNQHEPQLDKNLWADRVKRDKEAASIPEWEEFRELASEIKKHTLTHLDEYLLQFEENASKRGAIVHWARDAKEHNEILLEILKSHAVTEVIKSKSMLQQECGTIPFLEKHGITITESDLGERIQQLDDERPSHIVVPAVHKTKEDIAKLFAKKIGTDENNSDAHYLAEAMRNNARPIFMKAQAGMTGANFAVAETGSFVVCTNEGNADICTALPPLQIASIGIEKLVPTLDDLAIFIRMLSRSALGSKITQYTSHFTGPRNGSELHIILTDNLRTKRLSQTDFWESLKCIKCGACMNTCPVYRRGSGLAYGSTYPGPIGIILDPTVDEEKFSELPYHSSLCGFCSAVCPVKIDISGQIRQWRRVMAKHKRLPLSRRLAFKAGSYVLANPKAFRLAEAGAYEGLKILPDFLIYNKLLNAWGKHREMPPFARETFHDWYLKNKSK